MSRVISHFCCYTYKDQFLHAETVRQESISGITQIILSLQVTCQMQIKKNTKSKQFTYLNFMHLISITFLLRARVAINVSHKLYSFYFTLFSFKIFSFLIAHFFLKNYLKACFFFSPLNCKADKHISACLNQFSGLFLKAKMYLFSNEIRHYLVNHEKELHA